MSMTSEVEVLAVATGSAATEVPWAAHLRLAEAALAERNLRAAVRAWDAAHLAAVGSLSWEGLIEVGDAYLRIGEVSGLRDTTLATARRAYFAGLFRACQKGSLEGVLRTAEAFTRLGDTQVVDECVGLANLLASDDPAARARVTAFARERRLGPLSPPAAQPPPDGAASATPP
jgi:hypothetical protein